MKQIVLGILLMATGAFLWWAFSPLLFDTEVQDELDPTLQARLEAQRRVDEARQNQIDINSENNSSEEIISEPSVEAVGDANENPQTPRIVVDGPYPIEDTPGHPASGNIELIVSPEEKLIRYLDYDGTNGPDLKIYLSKDLEANDYIDLGDARGNKGDIIYGVPLDVDFEEYQYVLTWCEAFGVLFDYAKIN